MDSSDRRRDVGNVAAELQSALLGSDKVEEFLADVARAAAGLIEGALGLRDHRAGHPSLTHAGSHE
ncbi:MAG: hypothetical protein QOG20_1900 [Pseudonocardiales bacterium]|nr:hypothetical protein [Pseudonocardiales bacterium]